jgi:hypothetical protein
VARPFKIPPELYPEIKAKFDNGATRRELADEYGCTLGHMHKILHAAGVPKMREFKQRKSHKRYTFAKNYSEENEAKLRQMYCLDCASLREMAGEFGVAHDTVYRALKHLKVKIRPRSHRPILPEELHENIIADYLELKSGRKVADKYGVSVGTIQRIIKLWKAGQLE